MYDFLKAIWETAKATKKWWLFLLAAIITACVIVFSALTTSCQTARTEVYTHGGTVSVNTQQDKPSSVETQLNASYREADKSKEIQ